MIRAYRAALLGRRMNSKRREISILMDQKLHSQYSPIEHDGELAGAFLYVASLFPNHADSVDSSSVFFLSKKDLKKMQIPAGGGGYFSTVTKTVVVERDPDFSSAPWTFMRGKVDSDIILVHELLHYISMCISASRMSADDEDFANGYLVPYCIRNKGMSEKDIAEGPLAAWSGVNVLMEVVNDHLAKDGITFMNFSLNVMTMTNENAKKKALKKLFEDTEAEGKRRASNWGLEFVRRFVNIDDKKSQDEGKPLGRIGGLEL
jgi:hypothetical protein